MGGPNGAYKSRPKKSAANRRRRLNSQKKRLLDSGIDAAAVESMTIKEVRQALKGVAAK